MFLPSRRHFFVKATAAVAANKTWTPGNFRVIFPISDEGPLCGSPVNDPGDDRDAITEGACVAREIVLNAGRQYGRIGCHPKT